MADRTVNVRLNAQVATYMKELGRAIAQAERLEDVLGDATRKGKSGFEDVALEAGVMGAAVTLGLGKVVGASADFEEAMSHVSAATMASADTMAELSEAALKAGEDTIFSATEAAKAQEELAKAGVSTSDILGGGLAGSLDLAAAGSLELGRAAEIAAMAMTTFDLAGKDVGFVADVLAAGAGKSATSVEELAQSLQQSGLVASQFGMDLDDTVGVLSMFAQNGLRGSDAGTSLKTMLMRLTPQSAEAAESMERLGFSAFDAHGQFIGMDGVARELQDSLAGMSQQQRMATMSLWFGSDAIRGASLLYSQGADSVNKWNAEVLDLGYAAEVAARKTDNLRGDVEAFGGSLETAFIKSGGQANGVLRTMVQNATDAVNTFNVMPPAVQGGAFAFAGLAAAGLSTVAMYGSLHSRVSDSMTALQNGGKAAKATASGLSAMGKAMKFVGPASVALFVMADGLANAKRQAEEFVSTLTDDLDLTTIDGMEQGLARIREEGLAAQKVSDEFEKTGWGMTKWGRLKGAVELMTPMKNSVADAHARVVELSEAEEKLVEQHNKLSMASTQIALMMGLTEDEVISLADAYNIDLTQGYDSAIGQMQAAYAETSTGVVATDDLAASTEVLSSEVESAEDKLDALTKTLDAFVNVAFGMEEAEDRAAGQLADLISGIEDDTEELADIAGRRQDALDQIAELEVKSRGEDGLSGAEQRRLGNLRDEVATLDEKAAALREGIGSLDRNTEAGRDNADMMRGLVDSTMDLVVEMAEQGYTTEEITAKVREQRRAYEDQLVAAGMNREEVNRYLSVLDDVDGFIAQSGIVLNGADKALEQANEIGAALGRIAAQRFVDVAVGVAGGIDGHRASGGPVRARGMYEVNERGTELLSVGGRDFLLMGSQSGRVTPHDKLAGAVPAAVVDSGSSAGRQVTVHAPVTVNPAAGMNEEQVGRVASRDISDRLAFNGMGA